MKLALLQMRSGIDPDRNARTIADAAAEAAARGAAMLFTPEMSNLVDRDRERAARRIVDEDADVVLLAARQAARENGLWLQLGSLAVRRPDGRFANRAFVIDDTGAVRARYDKLHLFDVTLASGETWRESGSYAAGNAACVVATPIGPLGLSICYDLRFGALYRALADAGASVLSVPAAFTVPTGEAHWETLLRARAIECGAFVVAAAQSGEHEDGRRTWGHSMVVDPWGRVLLDMGDDTGVGIVAIDPDAAAEARRRIPVVEHARPIPAVTRIG